MSGPIYLFAGGGTGGHLYPALAVAERLMKLQGECRIVLASTDRPIDRRILEPTDLAIVPQPIRPLPRSPRGWFGFLAGYVRADRLARDLLRDLQPVAVLGTGGFAAVPIVRRAARAGVPAAILNPDAEPGIANRNLARYAEAVFTQFESTSARFGPSSRPKVRCVGCPVAGAVGKADRAEAIEHFGLRAGRKTLLVVGGSGGAEAINQAIGILADELELEKFADTWQMIHITGPGKVGAGCGGMMQVAGLAYCDRMDLAYAAADLAVARAGAVTVAELTATGMPAVLMPYPYAGGHQALNASEMARAGAAEVVEDARQAEANAAGLRRVLPGLLADEAKLDAMSKQSRVLSKGDAADQVARWLAGRNDENEGKES